MPTAEAAETVQTPAATEAPPASSATPAPEGAPAAAVEQAPAEAQEAPSAGGPSVRDAWKGLSPQERAEILRETPWEETFSASDWLKGKVGAQKQKTEREQQAERATLAAQVRSEIEAELTEQRRQAALEADDAYALLEIEKQGQQTKQQREQAAQAQRQEAQRLAGLTQQSLGQTVVRAFEKLPDPVKAVLYEPDGATFKHFAGDGTAEGGLAEAMQAAITAGVEALLKDRTPAFKAEIEAAVRRELNGESLAGEPSPDTRGGSPSAGALTWGEFDSHQHDPDWIGANRDRIRVWQRAGMPGAPRR